MVELPVVLGVKPRQPSAVATFAVEEAIRRRTSLRVVHASSDPAVSRWLFDTVKQIVASHAMPPDIDYVVIDGEPADVLLHEAHLASTVVVGADDAPWVTRAMGSEIAQSVAARADAPVIVVPRTATIGGHGTRVVAALDSSADVDGELAYALETASRQSQPLHVIYAAGMTSDYQSRQIRWHQLEDAVDRWRPRYPHVRVQTSVEPGHAVHTCVIASTHASVLVVGQPTSGHPRLAPLAVVARLLRQSSAPVAVVPAGYDRVRQ